MFYKKFVKNLMELSSILKKKSKSFVVKAKLPVDEVTYLFMNDYDNF